MTTPPTDGGPAFPRASGPEPRVDAFTEYHDGMSLRDWFAGMGLCGLSANPRYAKYPEGDIAHFAYDRADAMLKAREAKP